ncbi:vanadium-dependent haloperoxidase [Amycolatopsis anabasis]|uniref:vanadium-dependent haloperoxidase n=1 Tax=Amycolatopsis anabasis TaxID=1840409 RepID=UPI00131CB302|nr:vanadium-dependent haloperoxidase [Amycolatopsis anabasis]
MTHTLSRRSLLIAGATLATGIRPPAAVADRPDPPVVTDWNRTLLRIVRTPGAQPTTVHATRGFAMTHGALHDAVAATTGWGAPYLSTSDSARGASPVAAAAQAAHDILIALYPAMAADLDRQLAADLGRVPDPDAREAGVRAGRRAASRMLVCRAGDGSAATPPALPPGTEPGQYRPTPPGFAPAVFTHWAAVTPFVLGRADRFRPAPYPALTSRRYAEAIGEVERLGRDTSTARTADQTLQARFWGAPIWNYWNEIAQSVALDRRSDLVTTAAVFARLNLTFADTAIAYYDGKYHHRIWRPITAIRLGGTDTNPDTPGDPAWNSLGTTPPDPSYPGGHSTMARAGAAVLRDAYGPVHRVTVTSEAQPGTTRTFRRFGDIAAEAGLSRLFAGVHTRLDHDAGALLGENVARFVLDRTGCRDRLTASGSSR